MAATWSFGVVAFLDVLGFSNFIEEDARTLNPVHLERLLQSLLDVKGSPAGLKVDIRAFSDSIIISVPLSNESVVDLVEAVIELQRLFIKRDVLIRGAIALGKHFASSELVYSEALVKAYRLEQKTARFPRIVVDPNLLDLFVNDTDNPAELRVRVTNRLLKDRDNLNFINYLDEALLPQHKSLIGSYNVDKITAGVLEKLQWLAEYHNHVAEKVNQAHLVDTPLLAGFRAFAGK